MLLLCALKSCLNGFLSPWWDYMANVNVFSRDICSLLRSSVMISLQDLKKKKKSGLVLEEHGGKKNHRFFLYFVSNSVHRTSSYLLEDVLQLRGLEDAVHYYVSYSKRKKALDGISDLC